MSRVERWSSQHTYTYSNLLTISNVTYKYGVTKRDHCARACGLYDTAFFHVYERGSRASAVSHAPFKRVLFISNNNNNKKKNKKKKKTKSTTNFSYHVLAINKRRACRDSGNAVVAPFFSKTNDGDVLFKQQKTNPCCCTYDSGQTGVPFF